MGKSKSIFIEDREREYAEADCDGNCIECIRTCSIRQEDIIEYLNNENEEVVDE